MSGPRDTLAGRVLDGRYRLDERIGKGGMGEVYSGRHLMMDQRVAVKILRPNLSADPTAARRFTREARATFRLDHPNCIRVTDFGATDDDLLYLVMEYLDGRTVGEELAVDGPMAPWRVARIARQVCEALACTHDLSLVHRDLKPDNIMLVTRGPDPDVVKLLDFGLAKLVTGPDGALTAAFSMSSLTREGMVFGTPEYMSPEQATDEPLTPQTDIYSLGVVMYEMLGGALPFRGDTFMAVLTMHVRETPAPLTRRRPELGIPPALDALVLECLAKDPEARPPGARGLAARLAALEAALPAPESRVSSAVAASSTVDLDAQAVSRVATAETVSLHALPRAAEARPSSEPAQPARPRSRQIWLAGAALALAVAVAGALMLSRDPTASNASRAPAQDLETRTLSMPAAGPAAPDAAPGDIGDAGPDAGPVDARPEPAAEPRRPSRRASASEARARRRARAHLRAARDAQRAGNVLKQMAEADSALRLDPKSVEAAYLLGEALVHSDRARGCEYLQRARRSRKARAAYREAGCPPSN